MQVAGPQRRTHARVVRVAQHAQAPVGMVGYQVCIITFAFSTGVASVNLITTVVTMRARGMTWKRSLGTADGASATGSVPSIDSMSSRPS